MTGRRDPDRGLVRALRGPTRPVRGVEGTRSARAFYRRFGNWNAEEDVLRELRSAFDRTGVVRTFALGTNYVVVAEKRSPRDGSY
jgi:hypothetical protein